MDISRKTLMERAGLINEADETTLSKLTANDSFTLAQDAVVSATMGSGSYYKISHTKYGDITFVVVQVNRTTVDCITLPLDDMKKLPQSAKMSVSSRSISTPQGNVNVSEVIRFHVGKMDAQVTKM